MKKTVICAQIEKPLVEIRAYPENLITGISLPEGCLGVAFAFESKAAAKRWYGKNINFIEIERIKKNGAKKPS